VACIQRSHRVRWRSPGVYGLASTVTTALVIVAIALVLLWVAGRVTRVVSFGLHLLLIAAAAVLVFALLTK
jgi:hypothetical protein